MADSYPKKRNSGHIRGNSSSGRFFKRRRSLGHSRQSIKAALAIEPTTAAPLAENSGTAAGTNQIPLGNGGGGGGGIVMGQQVGPKQRHGRKRRRHRNSSFSGDKGTNSNYSLPPAVAAALAIPPKTPENQAEGTVDIDNANEKKSEDQAAKGEISGGHASVSGPSTATGTANGPGGVASKKKKRRTRRRRRQWKPYYKLTVEERRELEEREEKRAERIRAKRFAHGAPVAPYNTTQFLLRDRELRNGGAPDCGDLDEIVRNIRHHTRSGSCESPRAVAGSDSECGDASSDYSDYSYLEREFDNDWLDEQRQRLEGMSKDELVKEFMDLQKQYESAQRDMRSKRLSYEEEISVLRRENDELRLRSIPSESTSTSRIQQTKMEEENEEGGEASGSTDDVNYSSSTSASTSEPAIISTQGS